MATYEVAIHVVLDADSADEAWKVVATAAVGGEVAGFEVIAISEPSNVDEDED